jgi:hypothetical protein
MGAQKFLCHDSSRFDVVLPAIKSPIVIPHEIDDRDLTPVFAMRSLKHIRDGKRLDFARSVSQRVARTPHEEDNENDQCTQEPRCNGEL